MEKLKRYIRLDSVGSFMDTMTLLTYPLLADDTIPLEDSIDEAEGVKISECSQEWYDALSYEDNNIIDFILMDRETIE